MLQRPIVLATTVHVALALLTIGAVHSILLRRTDYRIGDSYLWIAVLGAALVAVWMLAGRVGADGPAVWRLWRRPDRHDLLMFAFFAVLLLLFVGSFERAAGDGRNYFSQVRSIVVDHDLDFANESATFRDSGVTAIFPVGTSVLWLPFYTLVYAWFGFLNLLGAGMPHEGYWNPYQQATGIAGLTYGCAGLFIAYRTARRLTDAGAAVAATVSLTSAGFLLWYLTVEPMYTHAGSLFLVTSLLAFWIKTRGARSTRQWAAMGAIAALMTMVRWQNILWVIPIMLDEAIDGPRILRLRGPELREQLRDWGLCIAVYLVVVLPQLLVWKANYGGFFSMPSRMTHSMWWHDPKPLTILFSPNHGLLTWSPIYYLALLGIPLLIRRHTKLALLMLVPVVAQFYLISSVQDWWGSSAYGARRFDSVTLVFILALALALRFLQRRPGVILAALLLPLVALNLSLISSIRAGELLNGRGVTFDAMVGALYERIGSPFSLPASLAFAVGWGGTAAQYDQVAQRDFNNLPIDVGSPEDARFLLRGWWPPEADDSGSFRWAGPGPSTFVAPLSGPLHLPADEPLVQAGYTLRIDLAGFNRPDGVAQFLDVEANGERVGRIEVPSSRSVQELSIAGDQIQRHLNHFVLHFGWHRSPTELGLGEDERQLAARVYRIDLRRQ